MDKSGRKVFGNSSYIIQSLILKFVNEVALNTRGKLLDFGCGSQPYRHLFSAIDEYHGLDLDGKSKLVQSNSEIAGDLIQYYDGNLLPYPNSTFDVILSTEVLEHIFDVEKSLTELHRVLASGGELIITIPFSMPEHEAPHDFARYTSFGIQYLLEKNGFAVIRHEKLGNRASVAAQNIIFLLANKHPQSKLGSFVFNALIVLPIVALGLALTSNPNIRNDNFIGHGIVAKKA